MDLEGVYSVQKVSRQSKLRLTLALSLMLSIHTAEASPVAPSAETFRIAETALMPVDAHEIRHRRNFHRHVYCHKRERLLMKFPPLTDTPHWESKHRADRLWFS